MGSNFLGIIRAGGMAMRKGKGGGIPALGELCCLGAPHNFYPRAWSCSLPAPSPLLSEGILNPECAARRLLGNRVDKISLALIGKVHINNKGKRHQLFVWVFFFNSSFKTVTEQIIQKFIFGDRVDYLVYTHWGNSLWWWLPGYHGKIVQFFLLHLK